MTLAALFTDLTTHLADALTAGALTTLLAMARSAWLHLRRMEA